MTENIEVAVWVARLDATNINADADEIQRVLDDAPEGAQQTPDYWYARGVVNARTMDSAAMRAPV